MRYARFALAVFGLAAGLSAADPFVGTWKLNPAKSKFTTGKPAKEQIVAIQQSGDQEDIRVTGTAATGTPISYHITLPMAGGAGTVVESKTFDAVSTKRLNTNTRENTYMKGGKPVMTIRAAAAKNGQTMTVRVKGTGADGNPVDGVVVFDKQ